jgi:3',5'-nucleoside bisphosphate phosphatase
MRTGKTFCCREIITLPAKTKLIYMKRTIFMAGMLFLTILATAQKAENGILDMDEYRVPVKRQIIEIPGFNGFQTLKCDFHMHTVFSDGVVWPTVRVGEAWKEGLDVIALTDHVEYQPHSDDMKINLNRSWELAGNLAAERNLILIKATEITRQTPPGHFNALFIGDNNEYLTGKAVPENDSIAVMRAVGQKAFIFWNHPGWKATSIDGSYEWIDFVDKLTRKKHLKGIEVFNGNDFYQKALDWAIDHNLTVMSNTDIHGLVEQEYMMNDVSHRTMTLVFAKERTEAGVREALEAGRTVAWSGKYLAGKEEHLKNLFMACVKAGDVYYQKGNAKYYEIKNNSDLYFELQRKIENRTETIKLFPRSAQMLVTRNGEKSLEYEVVTAFVRGNQNLKVQIPLEK